MLDENEFLSPHGIRGISRYHQDHPFVLQADGQEYRVDYEPAESSTSLFGGNSNWRGPVWFPVNYLMIESLQRFHHYFGDELQVEFPTGSGVKMNLARSGVPAVAPAVASVPARRARPAAGVRRRREIPDAIRTSAINSVLRVFPRRQRRGHGRQPSDRLDGAGRQAAAAKRRIELRGKRPTRSEPQFD